MASISNIDPACMERQRAAFRARMRAQCEQIEQYKIAILDTQGRRLSWDEAAMEWIERYAESFSIREQVG